MYNPLELLEWPIVFERLQSFCWSPYARTLWETETFLEDPEAIRKHLNEVDALKGVVMRYGDAPLDKPIEDCLPAIRRVAKGGVLNEQDCRHLFLSLNGARQIMSHFQRNWTKEPQWAILSELLEGVIIPEGVIETMAVYISPAGEILDSASPTLAKLRKKLIAQRTSVQQRMQNYLSNPNYAQALQAAVITERDGRAVLPVKVEFKTTVPGIIHSGSSSGSTLFVEPQGVIDLNNDIQKTHSEIQGEIQRILQELSRFLEGESEALFLFLEQLAQVDKRVAAARLSIQLRGSAPELVEDGETRVIDLKKARHPLLMFTMGKDASSKLVANDFRLGMEGNRTMLITGPNTGGKTVLLKTVGLCALMLRAGLHLPVEENSRMSLFDPILVDIGDQQSIVQNLSTFSAHLEKLKYFVSDELDLGRGLVLIDEIAAGTDPAEGAALAQAVLDELYLKGALTVVTTHLGELKLEAHHHPGYMNASVEFDPESLSPTYRLNMGIPGTSNAITIAQRLGLKRAVIEKARAALSQPNRESAELIEELEFKNRKAQEELHRAESFRLAAQDSFEQLELQKHQFQEEKRKTLQMFKQSLKTRLIPLEDQLSDLKDIVRSEEVDTMGKVRDLSSRVRGLGREADSIFGDASEAMEAEVPSLTVNQLKVGEIVKSIRLCLQGEVAALLPDSEEVVLQAGAIRVTLPLSDIEKPMAPRQSKKKVSKPVVVQQRVSKIPQALDASMECDVRGMRVEEAMDKVMNFLDQASLAGFETVGIIHGQGTGALKKAVREYLRSANFVKSFYPAEARFGGDGKTLIEMV